MLTKTAKRTRQKRARPMSPVLTATAKNVLCADLAYPSQYVTADGNASPP